MVPCLCDGSDAAVKVTVLPTAQYFSFVSASFLLVLVQEKVEVLCPATEKMKEDVWSVVLYLLGSVPGSR
eukprot:scaffold4247_cov139-Skeletonema_menzelii.AAC.3